MIRKRLLKKVAYFSVNSFVGGAEVATLNYCIYHKKIGRWSPILFVLEDGELVSKARKNNIPVVIIKSPVRMSRPLSILRAAYRLRKELKRNGISIIQASMGYAYIIAALATLNSDIIRVWYQHGPVGTLFDRIGSFFKSNLTFYNSSYLLNLASVVPASFDHKNYVVSPIVERKKYIPAVNPSINFAHIGRITPFKNIDGIIKNFSKLQVDDVFLHLYGDANSDRDRSYKVELINLVENLKLRNRVFFHGHTENLEEVYGKSDCVIHSAKEYEPFGLSIAESLISGMPLICSEKSGASIFFENTIECLKYRDDNEMLSALNHFIKLSKAERMEIGKRAEYRAKQIFGPELIINKIEKLYDQAIR